MAERVVIRNLHKALENLDKIGEIDKRHLLRYLYARSLLSPGDYVLDIACGSGYGSLMLAEHGCHVIAVDISEEALELAKKYNKHPNIKYIIGNVYKAKEYVENPPLDAVVCFETLEHVPDGQDQIVENFKSLVKKGQPIICSIPLNHPDKIWHKRVFSWKDRDKIFRECFSHYEYPEDNPSLIVGWNES